MSYRDSLTDLLNLPDSKPDFGRLSLLYVGVPPLGVQADFVGEIVIGDARNLEQEKLTLEKGTAGDWNDLNRRHSFDTVRWLKLVAFAESKWKVLLVDTTNPLSVLAIASLPKSKGTIVLAVGADRSSTPVEQNMSYVALSLALSKGFQVVVFLHGVVREARFVGADGLFVSDMEAFSVTLERVLSRWDDLMELLQNDLSLGIKLHTASTISSGSKQLYGSVANAVAAQAYQLPSDISFDEVKTLHSMIWCEKSLESEFGKRLNELRQSSFHSAIGSEIRFIPKEDEGSFEIFTLFGTSEPGILQVSLPGYNTVAKQAPALMVESVY